MLNFDTGMDDESQDRTAERQYDIAQRLKARSKRRLSNVMKQKEGRMNRLAEKENTSTNKSNKEKSAKKKSKYNRRWSDFPLTPGMLQKLPASKQSLSRSGKKSRKERRKSWAKSDCVLRIEEMHKLRDKMRKQRGEELRAKKKEIEQFGEWGCFAKMMQKFRSDLSMNQESPDLATKIHDQRITVCIRKRPLNEKQISRGTLDVITSLPQTVHIHEPQVKVDLTKEMQNHTFEFDRVFNHEDMSEVVYADTIKPLFRDVVAGGILTCFAYGQTGSGKTFTMTALTSLLTQDLFSFVSFMKQTRLSRRRDTKKKKKKQVTVYVSFYEIYMGKLFDLLNKRHKLHVLEDSQFNIKIMGLRRVPVTSPEGFERLMAKGHKERSTGVTSANAHSSRSHAVIRIDVVVQGKQSKPGQLILVDLAGSERAADTMNTDNKTRLEGGEINKSLLALKECIRSLDGSGQTHTPFRASKLTQVLREPLLAAKSHTVMIATVSADLKNCEHTLNTLRYAQRLKRIANQGVGRNTNKNGKDVGDDLDAFEVKKRIQERRPKKQKKAQARVRSSISDLSTVKVSRAMGKRFDADSFKTPAFQKTSTALMFSPTPTLEEDAQDSSACEESENTDSDDNGIMQNQFLDVCESHLIIPPKKYKPEEEEEARVSPTSEPECFEAKADGDSDAEAEAKAKTEAETETMVQPETKASVTTANTPWTCVVCKRVNEVKVQKCRVCGTMHGYRPRNSGPKETVAKSTNHSTDININTDINTNTETNASTPVNITPIGALTAAEAASTPLPAAASNTPLPDLDTPADTTPAPERSSEAALVPLSQMPKVDTKVVVLQGKYNGMEGTVCSVSSLRVRLILEDGRKTGHMMFNKLALASEKVSLVTPVATDTPEGKYLKITPTAHTASPHKHPAKIALPASATPASPSDCTSEPAQPAATEKIKNEKNHIDAVETPKEPLPALTKSAIKRNRRRWSMINSDEKQQFAVAVQNRHKTRPRKIQLFADTKASPAPAVPSPPEPSAQSPPAPSSTPTASAPTLPEPKCTPNTSTYEKQQQQQQQLKELAQQWEIQSKEELRQQQVVHEQELANLRRAHAENIAAMKASMIMQQRQHQTELERVMAEAKPQQQKAVLAQRELTLLQHQHDEVSEQLEALEGGVGEQITLLANTTEEEQSPALELQTPSQILDSLVAVVQRTLKSRAAATATTQRALDMYALEAKARKQVYNKLLAARGNIRVLARVRPMSKQELKENNRDVTEESDPEEKTVSVRNFKKERSKKWTFERVFLPTPQNTNKAVFEEVRPLVTSVVDGYNACVFAFGQTGAGKTYTMEGTLSDPGVNHRTLNELFRLLGQRQDQCVSELRVSMIEIYNENIRDLLNRDEGADERKLKVKLNDNRIGRHIPGLIIRSVSSVEDIEEIMREGSARRSMHATRMNDRSSRSHCVLSVEVFCTNKLTHIKTRGRLQLIDLAGSERLDRSGARKMRAKEAMSINKSLSCLADVVAARANKKPHVPYRNSTLTYVLQDSLEGDCKTVMIAQISPAESNSDESYSTLNFASRVRKVEQGQATRHKCC